MKKLFAIFLTISMTLSISLSAQQTPAIVDIADVIEKPGQVLIPVYVDFSMMPEKACAFDLTIRFNPNVLTTFVGVQNQPGVGSFGFTSTPGEVFLSWFATDPAQGLALNGKLLDLVFNYAGGCTELTFHIPPIPEGITEVGECSTIRPRAYPTNFIKGSICEEIPPVPLASWPIYMIFGLIIVFMVVGIRKFV